MAVVGVEGPMKVQLNLHKRGTFWKAKTVYYREVAVLPRVSRQKIRRVEIPLSVRFIHTTKPSYLKKTYLCV